MEDMVLEPMAVELLGTPFTSEIKVVNAHTHGNITKAVNGERVGTLIRAASRVKPTGRAEGER